MALPVRIDHVVIHVSDWERSVAGNPGRPGSADLCFAWDGTPESAVEHLERTGVEVIEGPVPRRGGRDRGTSVYFRDPDGALLELISYANSR